MGEAMCGVSLRSFGPAQAEGYSVKSLVEQVQMRGLSNPDKKKSILLGIPGRSKVEVTPPASGFLQESRTAMDRPGGIRQTLGWLESRIRSTLGHSSNIDAGLY